jgi:hypothetical protein
MRVSVALIAAAALAAPAAAAAPEPAPAGSPAAQRCVHTGRYVARDNAYRGGKLAPRKLTELPPATGYMAVYRHIGGCEAPLTMVEYRNSRPR